MILRLDHTAVAVWDPRPMLELWAGMLGGEVRQASEQPGGFAYIQFAFPGSSRVEVIFPTSRDDTFIRRYLTRRGEGLHHMTFMVDDLLAEVSRFRERGYRVVDENHDDPEWREAFLSPSGTRGTLVQLAASTLSHEEQDRRWSAAGLERVMAAAVPPP